MSSFLDQSLTAFLDQAAARQPAPGGGSAAALTVALAAGLTAMAARFSARQIGDSAELASQADELRHRAAGLIDEDARAYQAVLDTRRGSGAGSSTAQQAVRHAAIVPLQICELAGQTATLAARLAADGNPNLRGDAVTAALLAEAAARSAASLVRINIAAGAPDDGLSPRAAHAASQARAAVRDLKLLADGTSMRPHLRAR
jgi:formiminotetrahydrofolate cyclodeaminase